jgi:hypothetical protein
MLARQSLLPLEPFHQPSYLKILLLLDIYTVLEALSLISTIKKFYDLWPYHPKHAQSHLISEEILQVKH